MDIIYDIINEESPMTTIFRTILSQGIMAKMVKMVKMALMTVIENGHKYGHYWILLKDKEKCHKVECAENCVQAVGSFLFLWRFFLLVLFF